MKAFYAILLLVIFSCTRQPPLNKFHDEVTQKIADLQDRRATDSLVVLLKNKNPRYRAEAALGLGSVQDTIASSLLGRLLQTDTSVQVRRRAAFALGQTGGKVAVDALIAGLQDKNRVVVREVLEALGKTAGNAQLNFLNEFKATDSLTQEGLAWSFYRLGLRALADSTMANRAGEFLDLSYSLQTRLGAAQLFNRAALTGHLFANNLIKAALSDPSVEVRMAAARGLHHLNEERALPILEECLGDPDYRVRVNALRALATFPYPKTTHTLVKSLQDTNVQVAITASEVIRAKLQSYSSTLLEEAERAPNWRVQATLLEGLLGVRADTVLLKKTIDIYSNSENDYQKAALLRSIGKQMNGFEFLRREMIQSTIPVIKTSAASGLVSLNQSISLNKLQQQAFIEAYKEGLLDGDPAVCGIIASAFSNPVLHYKEVLSSTQFIREARARLSLPKDIESIRPLDDAIAYLEGENIKPVANAFNHPIDWELVKTIPANQKVKIETTKGDIVMELFVAESPGSVANFVSLVKTNYFEDKPFHRVVPNFVVQGGCNRGDGYGSEPYSIRSEFGLRKYKEGSVGMASAGKDTEGTQWFITHSATPHLDGGYTIFAEVIEGMDIVHTMEVGDRIIHASLMNN